MTTKEKLQHVREAKYGILAALEALELKGVKDPYITGTLSIALHDLRVALGEAQ
jgi:hypothetical protein